MLKKLGLEQYVHVFEENGIDYDAFIALQESDLLRLNVTIGVMAKIRKEIEGLKKEGNAGNDECMLDI